MKRTPKLFHHIVNFWKITNPHENMMNGAHPLPRLLKVRLQVQFQAVPRHVEIPIQHWLLKFSDWQTEPERITCPRSHINVKAQAWMQASLCKLHIIKSSATAAVSLHSKVMLQCLEMGFRMLWQKCLSPHPPSQIRVCGPSNLGTHTVAYSHLGILWPLHGCLFGRP